MTSISTTQRDELVVIRNIAAAVITQPLAIPQGLWPEQIALALNATGYRKPGTITTVAELNALPDGSVIRADNGEVFEKQADGPYRDGSHDWQSFEGTFWNGETFVFPATVPHEPEAEATR